MIYQFDNPQDAYAEATARIIKCLNIDDWVINLRKLGLAKVPPEIGQLIRQRKLHLALNALTELPPEIGGLVSLKELLLDNNKLTQLPPAIGNLTALTDLELCNNRLTSLPAEIGKLRSLTNLDLCNNQLTALPIELRNLPDLQTIYLHDNPALQLSPTVLGWDPRSGSGNKVSAKSILDFYFGREAGPSRPLNEVKLILVGRGGVGKTSTVRALRGEKFQDTEESTPGIALCDWQMEGCEHGTVTAHVWDFAGQVVTHALHQFFFSERSVYILVLTGRENSERQDAEYWLRLINAFGTDDQGHGPPVIVALNKWDVPGCRPKVDRGALKERYPFIRGFVEMDCQSKRGIVELRANLFREVDQLHWVHAPFPNRWDNVRLALVRGGKKKAYLTFDQYRALCAEHHVHNEGEQDSLAEVLHNLGAALNYRRDPRLKEATVLQPEWLTTNVYSLMRRAEQKAGLLRQVDVDETLRDVSEQAMREYLVRIMERFEISYPRTVSGDVWLVPQALPDEQPAAAAEFASITDATRLRYRYMALPEGLVARAIVRLHEFIEEKNGAKLQWASGAILSRDGARALLRKEPHDRQVMITVTGLANARQQLAGLCQSEMRDIHREVPGLDPIEETQVQGTWVATETLEADEKGGRKTGIWLKGTGTVLIDPIAPNNEYSVATARNESGWKPTIFICYSKSNLTQRKRLESELKILKNQGLLSGHWHDRMLDPGDKWDGTIQSNLATADVVIILVSSAALATDYITEHEIPTAMDLHRAGKTTLVPIILESCLWQTTLLRELNALPEKGIPVNKWSPRPDAWFSIAKGLETLMRKLIQRRASSSSAADIIRQYMQKRPQ